MSGSWIEIHHCRGRSRMFAALTSLFLPVVLVAIAARPARASLPYGVNGDVSLTSIAPAPSGGFWFQRDGRRTGVASGTYAVDGAPEFASVALPGTIVGIPGRIGYWVMTQDGQIYARGDAPELCNGELSNCSDYPKSPSTG